MGFEGLIFAVIAMAWLVYLIPLFLYRNSNGLLDEVEPGDPITPSVVIVRRGVPLDIALEATTLVSTPLNRRALLRDLDREDARAASRRRVVLGVLLSAVTVLGVLASLGQVYWWSVAIPAGLIGAFVGVARFTVVRMRADLEARAEIIKTGGEVEQTVVIEVLKTVESDAASIDLTPPAVVVSSLWDPIPITKPTYVSKPLAPRTVRTIDLSAPLAVGSGVPVTADAPGQPGDPEQGEAAVNE